MSERKVLEIFYKATGGAQELWQDHTNWGTACPLEEWYGVWLDDMGKVEALMLAGNCLKGELPPEIGQLRSLRTLDLFDNALSGSLPPEIGQLDQLD